MQTAEKDAAAGEGLKRRLIEEIAAGGPIGVDRFMSAALTDPEFGYYMTRDPLGRGGDFITAPEVSQMFGELAGLWLASEWRRMGSPDPVRLVELGPGRGTLMSDVLGAIGVMPGMRDAIDLHLVEASPLLKAEQRKRVDARWHEKFADIPGGPLLLVANEFFDALPIRQFVRAAGGWHERCVSVEEDRLVFVQGRPVGGITVKGEPGDLLETSPTADAVIAEIAGRIRQNGGAALIIDYGYATPGLGDSLQAVRRHKYVDVLEQPGEADLTAHVNFAALSRAAATRGVAIHGPVAQADFLLSLGIEERARKLARSASAEQGRDIEAALNRLTGAKAMGRLFKVLALTDPGAPTPAGFEVRR